MLINMHSFSARAHQHVLLILFYPFRLWLAGKPSEKMYHEGHMIFKKLVQLGTARLLQIRAWGRHRLVNVKNLSGGILLPQKYHGRGC